MSDSFVQVALDSVGKQIDMETVRTGAGSTIYQQRARLVGDSQDFLQQLYLLNLQQVAVMRAVLATLQNIQSTLRTPSTDLPGPTEDDFIGTTLDNG